MAGNFIPMVYAVLKDKGVETKDMTADEAVEKYNEIVGKTGRYDVETGDREEPKSSGEHKQLPGIDDDKKAALQKLVEALKSAKKVKMKELAEMIKNFQPIELHTDNKAILAEFDKFSAQKNLYTKGNSSLSGYSYKMKNVDKLPSIVSDSKYSYSKDETGKDTEAHKGVKVWHYFKGKVETDEGAFDVTINVRDKGNKQYVYEVAFIKEK